MQAHGSFLMVVRSVVLQLSTVFSLIEPCHMQVHMYSMYGVQLPNHFSMGSEVEREGILECQLYADGLVVLTKGLQLWAVSGLQDPRPQKLANPKLKGPPSCMAIFEPRHTLSGCLEVCPHPKESLEMSAFHAYRPV